MSFSITVRHDRPLAQRALRRFFLKRMGVVGMVGLPAVSIFLLAMYFTGSWDIVLSALTVVYLALMSTLAFIYILRRGQSEGFFERASSYDVTYSFDESGVRAESDLGSSELNWSVFDDVLEFPDVWLLVYARSAYVTLPTERLDEDLRAFILSHVGEAQAV